MSPRVKIEELDRATIEADVQLDAVGQGRWRALGDVPDENGRPHRLAALGKSRGDALGTWVGARVEREDAAEAKAERGDRPRAKR